MNKREFRALKLSSLMTQMLLKAFAHGGLRSRTERWITLNALKVRGLVGKGPNDSELTPLGIEAAEYCQRHVDSCRLHYCLERMSSLREIRILAHNKEMQARDLFRRANLMKTQAAQWEARGQECNLRAEALREAEALAGDEIFELEAEIKKLQEVARR